MYNIELWTGIEYQKLNDDPIDANSEEEALSIWEQFIIDTFNPDYSAESEDLRAISI